MFEQIAPDYSVHDDGQNVSGHLPCLAREELPEQDGGSAWIDPTPASDGLVVTDHPQGESKDCHHA